MADTLDAFAVPNAWTDLNTLSGIPTTTAIIVQCVGSPADVVMLANSASMPASDFVGVHCYQGLQMQAVPAGENITWGKFVRTGNQTPVSTTLLQIQENV